MVFHQNSYIHVTTDDMLNPYFLIYSSFNFVRERGNRLNWCASLEKVPKKPRLRIRQHHPIGSNRAATSAPVVVNMECSKGVVSARRAVA